MPSDFADENIYCLLSARQDEIARGPRYRSKVCPERCIHVHLLGCLGALDGCVIILQFAGRLNNKELCFGRREHKRFATMGLAKGIVTSRPEDFLRRSAGHTQASQGLHTLQPIIWGEQPHGKLLSQSAGTFLHQIEPCACRCPCCAVQA